ncbi:MAG: hypothetical protein JRN04_03750 [Nitrososphaerota archaeon]|jgi:hypothetical protein|nr:hypothetical protein [Nitrososphaerota archaeon]
MNTTLAIKTPATKDSAADTAEDPPDWGEVEVAEPVVETPVDVATVPEEVAEDVEPLPVVLETVD